MKLRWLTNALVSMHMAHRYIAVANPEAARRTIDSVERSIERITDFPLSGRIGSVPGTRELIVPGLPYLVVYLVTDSEVVILRVFHDKQDRRH
jgi:addiction module RelE/StbE family toxin